ncbi:ATP-binding protein [Candidatus Woesearchaeota archaeon]|nr:ATP-binding protein [Candidatus Woesearchaeota archaeon]
MHEVLAAHNPWGTTLEYGIDRLFHYQEIVELLHRKEIQVLSGIRRCGKTTLLKQCMRHLLDQGVPAERLLFVPCDDPLLHLRTFDDLHNLLTNFIKGTERYYIFLDEVQAVKDWEKYLKGRYDAQMNIKFLVSGSTASFFEQDVASRLTGRYFFHRIVTLQYEEYKRFQPSGSLLEYLEWGGFPEVVRAASERERVALLRSYLDTILDRDIIERCGIRNRAVAKALFESLLIAVGGRIAAERLAKQFKLDRRSVARYLDAAADSFLMYRVSFFSSSRRKNRHMLEKLYPCDVGFTRLLAKRFEPGRAAEWAVLHKIGTASYWSNSKGEVDFITENEAIQVTFTDDIPEREQRGLLMFRKIRPRQGVIVAKRTTENSIAIEEFLARV